jgi:hypothetical protein
MKDEGGLRVLDESGYWTEWLMNTNAADGHPPEHLRSEAEELIPIFVTAARPAKTGLRKLGMTQMPLFQPSSFHLHPSS